MKTILAKGLQVPVLGQGSCYIGENPYKAKEEKAALLKGFELGLKLIDTAEMYGDGQSEVFIGKTLKKISREQFMLISKVYPHNAGRANIFNSLENSLKRLNTDYLDIYLLHWRGTVPLQETVDCMEELVASGKIKRWGVSNFDVLDMEDLWNMQNGKNCAVNQVLYNLTSRGIEYDLLPWAKEHDVAIMAYCPLAQAGRLNRMSAKTLNDKAIYDILNKYGISIMQLMLAFTLRQNSVCAIPKASSVLHVEENAAVLNINISDSDWKYIDSVFLPPSCKMHLDME